MALIFRIKEIVKKINASFNIKGKNISSSDYQNSILLNAVLFAIALWMDERKEEKRKKESQKERKKERTNERNK